MILTWILLGFLLFISLGLGWAYLRKNQDLQDERISKTKIQAEFDALKLSKQEQEQQIKAVEERLENTFKAAASQALDINNKQFLDLAEQRLNTETVKAKADFDQKNQAIDNLVKPLKESLEKYQKHMKEMEQKREYSYGKVETELAKLAQATMGLKSALKKPHVRGRWGEVQLKNCIDLAGMSEHCDVSFQDQTVVDGQRLIPDMTVRMPGGRLVIVDSKTPIDAFLSALESENEEDKKKHMERHVAQVKKHIQDLSRKNYANNIKSSADFTVMFLPNESFLYAALESDPGIIEDALDKKIIIATPPTLIGFLKVIRFGWNEEQLAKNAMQISDQGKELHKRICTFTDTFLSIGGYLNKAVESFEKANRSLEHRVLVQAKRFEKLGVKSDKDLPEVAFLGVDLKEALSSSGGDNIEDEDL